MVTSHFVMVTSYVVLNYDFEYVVLNVLNLLKCFCI